MGCKQARVNMTVRYGEISASHISFSADPYTATAEAKAIHDVLLATTTRQLHDITDWNAIFKAANVYSKDGHLHGSKALAAWLDSMFGHG